MPTVTYLITLAFGLLGVALPMLIATSTAPTSTFFNQWLAAFGCGAWLLWWARTQRGQPAGRSGLVTQLLWVMLGLLCLATLISPAPIGQRLIPAAVLLLGMLLAGAASRAAQVRDEASFLLPLMLGLLAAGMASVVISLVQVFTPSLADGVLVAVPTTPGRAIGNMRQPNQLSTLLLWACAAAVWLGWWWRWSATALWGVLSLLVLAVVLTASRTGTVGVVLLSLWGVIDRRLPGRVRIVMVLMLPLYLLGWWGMEQWSAYSGDFFYGDDQIKKTLHGDASSSRGRIWSNTLAMIAAHPWRGIGVGAFNFVWTMTPFPDRPVAFFDHSHNIVLQLAVESGIPFVVVVLALFGVMLWLGRKALFSTDSSRAHGSRTALFMLLLIGVHSLLEYPLWYVYFLLPTALLLGVYAGAGDAEREASPLPDSELAYAFDSWFGQTEPMPRESRLAYIPSGWSEMPPASMLWRSYTAAGLMTMWLALWTLAEYWSVVVIFEPGLAVGAPTTLDVRIDKGRQSLLFGHHADYAAVTMAEAPEDVFDQFERPLFHLLDSRLMMSYARALAERGELDRASHVAARLREFRNPASNEFLAACETPLPAVVEPPFQCRADPKLLPEWLRPQAQRP